MMMPIDGSVDDAHTILGVEELNHFPPNFKEDIQKERLYWSRFEGGGDFHGRPSFGWVFWSQLDNFADKIRHALQKLIFRKELDLCLVQFWAATKTSEGRTLLTTQFQPFALGPAYSWVARYWRTALCEYRMGMCREYFYADAECAQEQLGLPGRVFLNQLPESTPSVELYTLKEYPQRDLALRCNIHSSWAVPVFDHYSHTCVGVLEIVSPSCMVRGWHDKSFLGKMYDIFQEFGLLCFDEHKHYEMQIGDENKACAFQELETVLETVCKIHELPLAMTWVPCSACNNLLQGQLLYRTVKFFGHGHFYLPMFAEVSKLHHLRKGGVARMVLSSPNMLYCSDITQLSLAEYPMVPYARQCDLRGWFTICLQSNYTANDIYVLEFFLPRSSDNSWTSLSLILGTMEENFSTFKLASGQELGDLLSVEVMDFQNGEKLHFIQKIRAKDGGEMLQLGHLDQPPMDAISNGVNVISEAQNYNLPSLEPLLSGIFPTQLNSSNQLSIDQSRNAHNVVIAEQNILVVPTSKERKRKMQDRKHKKAGVKIEVSLEEILKCSNMKRKYAARELKVSISTFKRVCRGYHIHRWPPRNIENANPFQPSPVENQRQIPQLNLDLPSNQALVGVSHIKPGFQDANMVTIRAKYENNNIKFRLPLSSRFVELREEVAKRLNIEAGTYYVKYKDEEDELILIACDEDLQDCMHTSRSLGKTSVVVLLELKQPITNLNPGLSVGQQTLFSPLRGQGLQSAEGELSNVPPVQNTGGFVVSVLTSISRR